MSVEEAINVLKSESSSDPSVSVDIAKLWDCRQDVFQDEVEDVTVRRDNIKEGGEIKSVRRVFVNKPQAKEYSNVGWVVNGDVEACMLCSTEFSFFNGRHHCRVCGCVSCRDCSSGELIISEFREYGPVRACDHCFCGQEEVSVSPHFPQQEVLSSVGGVTDLSPGGRRSPETEQDGSKRVAPRSIGTYLMKKSPSMMKGWQKRYVVIKGGKLKYYASKEDYSGEMEPKGEINLLQIPSDDVDKSVFLSGSANTEMHIYAMGDKSSEKKSKASKDRELILQATDEESAVAWVDILKDWVEYLNV